MADDPMDEVVGRVRKRQRLAHVSRFPNVVTLASADVDALLAAYQSVREDKARLDWLNAQRSINIFTPSRRPDNQYNANWAWYGPHETKGELAVNAPDIRGLLDRARTGGTE